MSDFNKLQKIVQRGIKSTETILNFYKGINDLFQSLQTNNLRNVSINFTVNDLVIHFPHFDVNTLQYFLKKQGVKRYTNDENVYYTIEEILSCFDFLFQSIGAPKECLNEFSAGDKK